MKALNMPKMGVGFVEKVVLSNLTGAFYVGLLDGLLGVAGIIIDS